MLLPEQVVLPDRQLSKPYRSLTWHDEEAMSIVDGIGSSGSAFHQVLKSEMELRGKSNSWTHSFLLTVGLNHKIKSVKVLEQECHTS